MSRESIDWRPLVDFPYGRTVRGCSSPWIFFQKWFDHKYSLMHDFRDKNNSRSCDKWDNDHVERHLGQTSASALIGKEMSNHWRFCNWWNRSTNDSQKSFYLTFYSGGWQTFESQCLQYFEQKIESPCKTGTHDCDPNSSCIALDDQGNYQCNCNIGFTKPVGSNVCLALARIFHRINNPSKILFLN